MGSVIGTTGASVGAGDRSGWIVLSSQVREGAAGAVAAARRSRRTARAERGRAELNRQVAIRRGGELIGLRWRARSALYDRHGPVLAMWSAEQEPPQTLGRGISLDRLVYRLFEAGLAVTACQTQVDARVAAKLESVTDLLDSLISDLRQAVFEAHGALSLVPLAEDFDDPPPSDPPDPTIVEQDGLLPILEDANGTVERLWRLARDDDEQEAAVALREAARCLHRALLCLQGPAAGEAVP